MLFYTSDASHPMEYVSSGNLVSENGFVHPRRNIDTFVIIMVNKGTLHITQDGVEYDVREDEFMLLFPHKLHFGHRPSEGQLSYYWSHFYVRDPNYRICSREDYLREQPATAESFRIPEYGKLSVQKRSHLLFVQLLDVAKRGNYTPTWRCHYALSHLLLETTNEAYHTGYLFAPSMPVQVFDVMEWIRTHYDQPMTVAAIAARFNYHPTYLTNLFRKHTGLTILAHLNQTRIAAAKNLLTNRDRELCIYEIAELCGFSEVKYFLKLFKRYEGMTPSQYRKAFYQKNVNLI